MDANETLKILSKQWANVHDIVAITGFKKSKAYEIIRDMRNELISQGYMLPKGLIPMDIIVEKFKINIDYLERMKNNV